MYIIKELRICYYQKITPLQFNIPGQKYFVLSLKENTLYTTQHMFVHDNNLPKLDGRQRISVGLTRDSGFGVYWYGYVCYVQHFGLDEHDYVEQSLDRTGRITSHALELSIIAAAYFVQAQHARQLIH